jgi:hypothetical protein
LQIRAQFFRQPCRAVGPLACVLSAFRQNGLPWNGSQKVFAPLIGRRTP